MLEEQAIILPFPYEIVFHFMITYKPLFYVVVDSVFSTLVPYVAFTGGPEAALYFH
jgi:hypothetical protein